MGRPTSRRHFVLIRDHALRCGLWVVLAASAHAQTSIPTLPEAPLPACPATVTGSIIDTDGDEIPFAHVALIRSSTEPAVAHTAAPDGTFSVPGLAGGPCSVRVSAEGFLARIIPVTSPDLIVRLVPSEVADVTVIGTQEEVAEAQIHLEETQMIAGFVPNFYVAYDFHAAPLNKRQKFQLAYKTLINPFTNMINAGVAGLEQADNALPGYGQGAQGYAKRFGAQTADTAIATMLAGAVMPILFKQDPRYFYMGKGSIVHRTLYALSTSVIARGDNGKWQPAYASLVGGFGAGAISNLYYPESDRSGATVALYNGLIGTALDGVGNVVQEFFFKHLTPHAPVTP